ncbi:MAG: peptide deformylase [Planctomycetota bacterium]
MPAQPPDTPETPDPRQPPPGGAHLPEPISPDPAAVDPAGLAVVLYPAPVLRRVAAPLAEVTDYVRAVALRMIDLMYEARGVGLAAPQVGLPWRMFVANPTHEPGEDRVFINPVLREPAPATAPHDEGCLSLPQITVEVTRPTAITIDALDLDGQPFSLTSDDFAARVWQHEFDHLNGVLILDKMTRIDRMANKRAIAELEANA